jgi:hypothetical protein
MTTPPSKEVASTCGTGAVRAVMDRDDAGGNTSMRRARDHLLSVGGWFTMKVVGDIGAGHDRVGVGDLLPVHPLLEQSDLERIAAVNSS